MSSAAAPPDGTDTDAARGGPKRSHRRAFGLEMRVGAGLLLIYAAAGVSAVFVFYGSLGGLSSNPAWVPAYFTPPGPSWTHPFGVLSGLGTGLFTALWKATPWDLGIVTVILGIDAGLGVVIGGFAGMHPGGSVDQTIMFISDAMASIPAAFLVMVLFAGLAITNPPLATLPIFLVLFGVVLWPTSARLVRERARVVASTPFVEASRASGARDPRVLFRHVIPSSLGPVLAQIPVDVATIFLVLSVFTWFHNCVQPGVYGPSPFPIPLLPAISPLPAVNFPEWGNLLGIGACWGFGGTPFGPISWWMFTFPLLAIVVFGVALGMFCDGLEKWLSVRA